MKRRDALKNIGLAAGFAIATPSLFSLLQSCNTKKAWIPKYFTQEEKTIITNLTDIILPKTENTPSAAEINIPQFIDKYIYEVLEDEDQDITRTAFNSIIKLLKPNTETNIKDISIQQYKALLDEHMLIKGEIDKEREANPEALIMTNSEFLNQLKWMTINAFRNSEQVAENILIYDPIPTAYYCGDLQELTQGKSYSL